MTPKFPAASKLAMFACCGRRRRVRRRPRPARRPSVSRSTIGTAASITARSGPNRSYQQGPRTRVYVTTRSWLDAGTEVLPGDRKFHGLRLPVAVWIPDVRARKPQPPDRPSAAQPAVGFGRLSDQVPAVLSATSAVEVVMAGLVPAITFLGRRELTWMPGTSPATQHFYACSFCSSFRIASPICVVLAEVVPSDLISAVRSPLASTAAIAASTLSASAPMSKE